MKLGMRIMILEANTGLYFISCI